MLPPQQVGGGFPLPTSVLKFEFEHEMCAFSQLRGNSWSRQICNTKGTLLRTWQTNKGRMESSWSNSSFTRWQVKHLDFKRRGIRIPDPLHGLHNLTIIEGYFEYQWVAMMSTWTWCNKYTGDKTFNWQLCITCQRVWFLEMPQSFDEGIHLLRLKCLMNKILWCQTFYILGPSIFSSTRQWLCFFNICHF